MQKLFIIAKAKDNTPEVLVYGLIGGDDANSTAFVKAIKELEKKHSKIKVRINSEGGSVLQGLAMFSAIANSCAEIDTYIDGFAGSMAADLAMAGKKVYMSKYARLMTHSASGAGGGNADHLRDTAKLLDSLDNTRCLIYAKRTGKTPEQCLEDYVSRKEDKWFTPDEALAERLIDGIYDGDPLHIPVNVNASNIWKFYDEHRFAAVFNNVQNQNENMELKLSAASMAALNITAGATDPTAIDTAIAQLKAKADQVDAANTAKEKAEQDLNELKAANVKNEVTAQLDKAIDEKRITVEQKTVFAKQYAEKPAELKELLATMKPFESKVAPTSADVTDAAKAELTGLMAKTGMELWTSGKITRLKELNKEAWKAKYKEAFGEEPVEEDAN